MSNETYYINLSVPLNVITSLKNSIKQAENVATRYDFKIDENPKFKTEIKTFGQNIFFDYEFTGGSLDDMFKELMNPTPPKIEEVKNFDMDLYDELLNSCLAFYFDKVTVTDSNIKNETYINFFKRKVLLNDATKEKDNTHINLSSKTYQDTKTVRNFSLYHEIKTV